MSRAIVTGASGGLGLEFAKLLAADKYDLVLIARSAEKLDAIAADLQSRHGVSVETLALDLSRPGAAAIVLARAGYGGMLRGRDLVIPGLWNNLVALSPKMSPRRLMLRVSRKIVE